jgi:transposase
LNINAKIANDKKKQREIILYERRVKVAAFLKKNPYIRHAVIAKALGVSRSTITRDIREMNEELKAQTMDDFMVQRKRVLNEIQKMKRKCMRSLDKFTDKTKGSRWVEEWSTLVEKECKILGLYAPERIFVGAALGGEISPEQKDAAVDAVVRVIMNSMEKGNVPQLPAPNEVIDVRSGSSES